MNLKERTCGCRRWDLTGVPYTHAIFAILYDRGKPEDYVDDYYTVQTYMKAYGLMIHPMPSMDQWGRIEQEPVLPPHARVQPGRPKKLRRRGTDEPRGRIRLSKIGTKIKCSKCGVVGHNSRSCKKKKNTPAPSTSQSTPTFVSLHLFQLRTYISFPITYKVHCRRFLLLKLGPRRLVHQR